MVERSRLVRPLILGSGGEGLNMLYIAYMKLTAKVSWHVDDVEFDPRILRMLEAISRCGTLSAAIGEVGLSYRHAWGLLAGCENLIGQRLVTLERGRGAQLTKAGERLVETSVQCHRELSPQLERWAAEFGRNVIKAAGKPSTVVVRASHDLALAQLRDMLARKGSLALQLSFEGSIDALRALSRYQCDFAGLHVPESPLRSLMLEPFRPLLDDESLCLVHFADREQGLMVAPGNPLAIDSIRAVARRKARFVNRQPGSGTRLFFDQLLAAHGVRPQQINGYRSEEFTHAAVAATVASGIADCGFGIEAAARQQHLEFVPIASEHYYLAARKNTLQRPAPRAFIDVLRGKSFRQLVASLPGYRAAASLEPISPRAALL